MYKQTLMTMVVVALVEKVATCSSVFEQTEGAGTKMQEAIRKREDGRWRSDDVARA